MKRNSVQAALAATAMLALASCGGAGGSDCPSEEEVQASIKHNIVDITWDQGERDIWKVADVSGFSFQPMKFGSVVDKQVEWGKSAQPVCTVRVEYDYKITGMDGSVKDKHEGANQTYLFYKNAFGEWVFKVESG